MSQVYMTAKLNLADGTILYPQVSLDNIVASISDPTLVSVATTTNGKVPVTELPVVTVVGDTGSNNNIPTEAAVRALADTKQNTLVAGTGTEIINGSTINAMAVNLNDVVVNNVPNNGLYLEVEGNTMSVVGELAANDSAGVIAGASDGVKLVNGVAQFDNTTVDAATPVEITGATADPVEKVIRAQELDRAVRMSGHVADISDMYPVSLVGNLVTGSDGVSSFTGWNGNTYPKLQFNDAAIARFTVGHRYLFVTDVFIETDDDSPGMYFYKGSGSPINIPGYDVTTFGKAKGVWHTLAGVYAWLEGDYLILCESQTSYNKRVHFKIRNLRVVDVTGVPTAQYVNYVENVGYIYEGGSGILVEGEDVNIDDATTREVMTGTATDKVVTPKNIKDAFSVGQAVDCTAAPITNFDDVVNIDDSAIEGSDTTAKLAAVYRDSFKLTTSSASTTAKQIGFYSPNYYPKAAETADQTPLKYLFMADVTNSGTSPVIVRGSARITTTGNDVMPSFLGAAMIPPQGTIRVAFIFYARMATVSGSRQTNTTAYIAFTNTESAQYAIEISKMRQFEVNALSEEAARYLGLDVTDPDNADVQYLIKNDMVDPWVNIIDMKQAPAVTLASGLAYKSTIPSGGACTFSTDTVPAGTYGKDAHLTLFIGQDSQITFQQPLNLIDPLTPNAGHNMTIKYRDGQANAYVDDTDVGYVVTVNGGTGDGSLWKALQSPTEKYIVFSHVTDGTPIDLPEASTNGVNLGVVIGNGTDKTFITGSSINSNQRPVAFQDCKLDVYMYNYSMSKYRLTNVLIDGHVGQVMYYGPIAMTNCVVTGCTYSSPSNAYLIHDAIGNSVITDCVFSDNTCWQDFSGRSFNITGSTFGRGIRSDVTGGTIKNCLFTRSDASNSIYGYGAWGKSTIVIDGCTAGNSTWIANGNSELKLAGANISDGKIGRDYTTNTSAWVFFMRGSSLTSPNKTCVVDARNICYGNDIYEVTNGTFYFEGITITGQTCARAASADGQIHGSVTFKDCLITGNTSTNSNGGFQIHTVLGQTSYITGTTVTGNTSGFGSSNGGSFKDIGDDVIENSYFGPRQDVSCQNAQSITFRGENYIGGSFCDPDHSQYGCFPVFAAGSTVHFLSNFAGNYGTNEAILANGGMDARNGLTVITKSGSTVSLQGIGTRIYADGTSNLQSFYTVTATGGTGSGSLYAGLTQSTNPDPFIVMGSDLESDPVAELDVAVTNRATKFSVPDSRYIASGTFSFPAGTTVSMHYVTENERAALNWVNSSITISGGSATVVDTWVFGIIKFNENATISGTLAGGANNFILKHTLEGSADHGLAVVVGSTTTITNMNFTGFSRAIRAGGNTKLKITGCTFTENIFTESISNNGGGAIFDNTYGNITEITNCVFDGNQALNFASQQHYGGALLIQGGTTSITGCTFSNNGSQWGGITSPQNAIGSDGGNVLILNNCTFDTDQTVGHNTNGGPGAVKLSGTIVMKARFYMANNSNNQGHYAPVTIAEGTVLDLRGNPQADDTAIIASTAANGVDGLITVEGTITVKVSDSVTKTIVPATYRTIYRDGSTLPAQPA